MKKPTNGYKLRRYQLVNTITGECYLLDKSAIGMYRTTLKLDALLLWATRNDCVLYFFTVTIKPRPGLTTKQKDDYRCKLFRRLYRYFKRAGIKMKYIWCWSYQIDRWMSDDFAGTPCHAILACPVGSLPNQQSFFDDDGDLHWHTISPGELGGITWLRNQWHDDKGHNLGTLNCGQVNDIAAVRGYFLKNVREAEKLKIPARCRFGGSQFGYLASPRGRRRKIEEIIKAHPDKKFNKIRKKGGKTILQQFRGKELVYQVEIPSEWTVELVPEREPEMNAAVRAQEVARQPEPSPRAVPEPQTPSPAAPASKAPLAAVQAPANDTQQSTHQRADRCSAGETTGGLHHDGISVRRREIIREWVRAPDHQPAAGDLSALPPKSSIPSRIFAPPPEIDWGSITAGGV